MNGKLLLRGSRTLAGGCLLLAAAAAMPQDRPLFPGQNTAQGANNDALSLLLDQNNQLRTELQALRALVEEQGFSLRRLQRDSLSRYTNMDERLQNLENRAPAPAEASAAPPSSTADVAGTGNAGETIRQASRQAPEPAVTEPASIESGISSAPISAARNAETTGADPAPASPLRNRPATLQPAVLSEQQLYQMAYESAINSNFERSIAEFDQYLNVYPEGRFVSNAHYWKGQSYLYLNHFDEAREAYEIIINEYADSPKLPDAMYGLGQAFQGLGDSRRARELYNSIKRRYPNTGVANLADTRLLSLD